MSQTSAAAVAEQKTLFEHLKSKSPSPETVETPATNNGADGLNHHELQPPPVYPLSTTGTCPYCGSAYVVYLVLSRQLDSTVEEEGVSPLLQRLLELECASRVVATEEVPDPPSFQCTSCTYGFNLDWACTNLETIYQYALSLPPASAACTSHYPTTTATTTTTTSTNSVSSSSFPDVAVQVDSKLDNLLRAIGDGGHSGGSGCASAFPDELREAALATAPPRTDAEELASGGDGDAVGTSIISQPCRDGQYVDYTIAGRFNSTTGRFQKLTSVEHFSAKVCTNYVLTDGLLAYCMHQIWGGATYKSYARTSVICSPLLAHVDASFLQHLLHPSVTVASSAFGHTWCGHMAGPGALNHRNIVRESSK